MSNTDNNAVEIKNLSKHFILPHQKANTIKSFFINPFSRYKNEKQTAFKDISFNVKKGEFFGIVGRNGSGKSTLLKCIAGVYSHDTGSIKINGRLVPFIELGVGFNDELSGRDNVYLNGSLLGFNRKEMENMYDDIVEFSELDRFMDQKLKNYSSGMQVRLAFSIAIRARGDILVLDEVLAVGDSAFQQKCFDYFEEIKSQNKTVILVSHSMDAVRRFCNRAIFIKDGKIRLEGSPLEIADYYANENLQNPETKGSINPNNIHISIINQEEDRIMLSVNFKSDSKSELGIGISLLKDGNSVAEINTLKSLKTLPRSGTVLYDLDLRQFNGGVYQIASVLFTRKSKRAICFGKNKTQFVIEGFDSTKGGALKLKDTWSVKD